MYTKVIKNTNPPKYHLEKLYINCLKKHTYLYKKHLKLYTFYNSHYMYCKNGKLKIHNPTQNEIYPTYSLT